MKRYVPMILRLLLGLIFVGLNLTAMLMQMKTPEGYPPEALALQEAMQKAGYFNPMVITVEFVSGLALLIDFWTPLFLIVLAPVTVNILLFHLFLTPKIMFTIGGPGILVFVLNWALLWIYRDHYRNLLVRRAKL